MTSSARISTVFTIVLVITGALLSQTHAVPSSNVASRHNSETFLTTLVRRSLSRPHTSFRPTNELLQEPWLRGVTQRPQFAIRATNETTNSTTVEVKPQGYTFDICKQHEDCIEPRRCARHDWEASCNGTEGCVCVKEKTKICKNCSECGHYPMETCILGKEYVHYTKGVCASNYTVYINAAVELGCNSFPDRKPKSKDDTAELSSQDPTPPPVQNVPTVETDETDAKELDDVAPKGASNTGGGIDAELLQHLTPSQRVYEVHVTARALCDMEGSCATPGHMIVYKGHVQMMQDYCARRSDGCVSRSIPVNSPRYEKALRVPSRTPGLHFTALAARFETRVEGHALALAIRLGL